MDRLTVTLILVSIAFAIQYVTVTIIIIIIVSLNGVSYFYAIGKQILPSNSLAAASTREAAKANLFLFARTKLLIIIML